MEKTRTHHDPSDLTEAEIQQVELHRQRLSDKAGYEVGRQCAIDDWLENCADQWRKERLKKDLAAQREEMKRHRWIESERAGKDLGSRAELEWVHRYAAAWRKERELQKN